MTNQSPDLTACGNCGALLRGPFCHACGQKRGATHLSLHELFHEAFHELAHVDGKIVRTLGLLIRKPGALTVEFLNGRRARYVAPLRLYLTCSLLFFGVAALVPNVTRPLVTRPFVRITPSKSDPPVAVERAAAQAEADKKIADQLGEDLLHSLPRAMFLLMPVFGLLTWAFYRKAQPYYVAHLYHSIHFHAFAFLLLAVSVMLPLAGRYGTTAGGFVPLAILPYHYLSLRRVFGGSRRQTAWKATVIWLLYWMAIAAVVIVLFLRLLKALGILGSPGVTVQ